MNRSDATYDKVLFMALSAKSSMLTFQKSLRRWEPTIKKATNAMSMKYSVKDNGDFTMTVYWVGKDRSTEQYSKEFTSGIVFRRIAAGVGAQPIKRTCRFVDDVIVEVLAARGV